MKPLEAAEIESFLHRCRGAVVGVVGDVMLDRFVWGKVSRISPEAPVPVVEVEREDYHLGGAANVARNLASLGGSPLLLGIVGEDEAGATLRRAFEERELSAEAILSDSSRRTTVKTRVIAQGQQVVRADWESREDLAGEIEERCIALVEEVVLRSKALVLSDYSKGTLTPKVIDRAIAASKARGVPLLVDPKLRPYRLYRGVTLVTPNVNEAARFTGIDVRSEGELEQAAGRILEDLECEAVLITRGEQGMSLYERERPPLHIATAAREVFDVTGAGDTVIATAALALACGESLPRAAELSNRAAGIVVGKLGTATVLPEELLAGNSNAAAQAAPGTVKMDTA
jgi:D-beta-D-heptose 7-phosphate kinase/D-beta-D-heptose 1-phosphate adenosyltransferase